MVSTDPAAIAATVAREDLASTPSDSSAAGSGGGEDDSPASFDDGTEAAFLAEARERGEIIPPAHARELEEVETAPLPALDELVKRIPADVRAALEDLFRARFVSVKRVPKKVLKS